MPFLHFTPEAGPLVLKSVKQGLQRRLVRLRRLGFLKSPGSVIVKHRRRGFLKPAGAAALIFAGYELQHHVAAVAVGIHAIVIDCHPLLRVNPKS